MNNDWRDLGAWTADDLADGLKRYIADDTQPIFPVGPNERSRHVRALAWFVMREKPDPAKLAAVFRHGDDPAEVTDELLRRDVVGTAVTWALSRRGYRTRDRAERAACYEALAEISVAFAFDRAYGDAHTYTGVVVTDFLSKPEYQPNAESAAALKKHYPAIIREWRRRVTDKGSSTFFGIVMRHLGNEGTAMLFREWSRMNPDEREDLLRRIVYEDEAIPAARKVAVEALLDDSFDVRDAAYAALRAHAAPLGEMDASTADEAVEKELPRLRKWAQETGS